MIGTVDVAVQALNPSMPLYPMRAFVSSPTSIRVRNVPKRIGKWAIESVQFVAAYPDGSIKTAQCVLTGGVWVGTIEGTSTSGTSTNGYTIFASGTDENGEPVTGYILGKGDIEILNADGTLNPDAPSYYVHLLSAQADVPKEGDLYPTLSGYMIWQNGQANQLGTPFEEITAYVESQVSSKADLSALELKQDQLSETQLSAIDQDANAYYTSFYVQGESQEYSFIASSTLSKSDFAAQGVYDTTTGTWTKNLTGIRTGTNVTSLEANLFKDVTTLTYFEGSELLLATGGAQAFGGCTGLQTLILPKITRLPANICKDCTALRNLTIPASVNSIGINAFQNCSNLQIRFQEKTIDEVQAMANYPWGLNASQIKADRLSDNQIFTIDQNMDEALTEIIYQVGGGNQTKKGFPRTSTLTLQDFADAGMYNMTAGTWIHPIVSVKTGSNVKNLDTRLFKNLTSLTKFDGPKVEIVGGEVFSGCTGLNQVSLPSVKELMVSSFLGCTSLTSLNIPASITDIYLYVFNGCTNLTVNFQEKTLAEVQAMSNYPWGLATSNITASKTATQEWTKTWVTGQNYATQTWTQTWVTGQNYATQTQLAKKRNFGDMGAGGSPEDSNSWFIINGARLDYSNGSWTNGTYTISIDEIGNNSIYYQITGPNHLSEVFTLDDDFTATVTDSESGNEYFIIGYTDTIATTTYAVKNDGGVAKVKSMTQAAYDALVSPDATTLYVIPEEV